MSVPYHQLLFYVIASFKNDSTNCYVLNFYKMAFVNKYLHKDMLSYYILFSFLNPKGWDVNKLNCSMHVVLSCIIYIFTNSYINNIYNIIFLTFPQTCTIFWPFRDLSSYLIYFSVSFFENVKLDPKKKVVPSLRL